MNAGSGFPPLQYHEWGIYNPWSCDPTDLDHAVLLVGYGQDGKLFLSTKKQQTCR
jgi:hypothetical protein